jgi:hypothetical protein
MCFCETNPIYSGVKKGGNLLWWKWMRSRIVNIAVRFVWRERRADNGWARMRWTKHADRAARLQESGVDDVDG